jgi:hypothetical protein
MPQKSTQKKAPELLALRVPVNGQLLMRGGKNSAAPQTFATLIATQSSVSGCVTRDEKLKNKKFAISK